MVKFEFNEVVVDVPESWDDITLGHFETFFRDKPEKPKDRVAYIARICKVDPAVFFDAPSEVFNKALEVLDFVFNDQKTTPASYLEIKDKKYFVNIEDKLTLAEWIDAETAQGGEKPISGALAVVCRPAGETYNTENSKDREKMFSDLPVSKVLPVLSFFIDCKIASERTTRVYSILNRYRPAVPSRLEILRSVGGGIKPSTIWRTVRLLITTECLRYQLRKFSRN